MPNLPRFLRPRFWLIALCTLLLVTQSSGLVSLAAIPGRTSPIALDIAPDTAPGIALDTALSIASDIAPETTQAIPRSGAEAFQQGQSNYEQGQYEAAIAPLQQAIAAFERSGDRLQAAIALSNLALVYQQLGRWSAAAETVQASRQLIDRLEPRPPLLASVLDLQGNIQLNRGNMEVALTTWEQSEILHQEQKNLQGVLQSRINQAQALRMLGFYQRARSRLTAVSDQLETSVEVAELSQPQLQLKINLLHMLGDALRLSGNLPGAEEKIRDSLDLIQNLNDPALKQELQGRARMSLASAARLQGNFRQALNDYRQVAASSPQSSLAVEAGLAELSLQLNRGQASAVNSLLEQLLRLTRSLPRNQIGLYSRLHLARMILETERPDAESTESAAAPSTPSLFQQYQTELKPLLDESVELAQQLGDRRSLSNARGTLGTFYEQTQNFNRAIAWTQEALQQSQAINATDISYRWNWQLGRLQARTGNTASAIEFYDSAIDDLGQLRSDLVAVNRDIQFSFKESVEPVYRQSVGLLVQKQPGWSAAQVAKNLEKARERIEALQVAELDNFFREACLDGRSVVLDEVVDQDNPTTAVVYPILLEDRLEVVVKVPGQPELQHYTTAKPRAVVEKTVRSLRENLLLPSQTRAVQSDAQTLYSWLIQPFEPAIREAKQVDTLVFVLDGALRNVPMGVLFDGQSYLVERYGIGISLGLQLLEPKAIAQTQLNVLAAGLVNPPENSGFAPLPFIKEEFEKITATGVKNQQILNEDFTSLRLGSEVRRENFNVVHLATHGKFSSKAEDTFILAADKRIQVGELDTLLRDRDRSSEEAIELLILSACETADGDERAALGLAGVAIKAGARSTVASLWQADDESTAILMGQFYEQLTSTAQTKAQALRQAQLSLLANRDLNAPAYWAPYVLVGNWL